MAAAAGSHAPPLDLYAALGPEASPETPQDELRALYEQRVKDGAQAAADAGGPPFQKAALHEAWVVLQDPSRRQAYDAVWRRDCQARGAWKQSEADGLRRRGNDLYSAARDLTRPSDKQSSLAQVQEGLKLYKAAMHQYTKALDLTPCDHRLVSNRAMCYLAVEDYPRCREDAAHCIEMQPGFAKGWYILVKALWQMGSEDEALRELERGLAAVPGSRELLELQVELATSGRHRQPVGRSVSPACTPSPSRQTTPKRRPPSPRLVAAGASAIGGRSFPAAGTPTPCNRTGSTSRSPSAAARLPCPPSRVGPCPSLDASMTCPTGNFGLPTPTFAAGPGEHTLDWPAPPPPPLPSAGRSTYSPGPSGHTGRSSYLPSAMSTGTVATATASQPRHGSRSPGPALPRPELPHDHSSGTEGASTPPAIRRSPSFKGALDAIRSVMAGN